MSEYDKLSREELLSILTNLENKRAFTYEDQLKLTILDKSPFTMWASDRNCIIRMWEGQCESMYGRKKEDVIGRDFVDLFVAPDEQAAARRDQLEIIDNDKDFHNIANDQGRNGNTLQLITNCFRIKDPDTGEYWNAEMGIAIDYYEEEKKQLERNIEEGKLIQSLISDFSATQNQYREQFFDRKESLLTAIRSGRLEAARKQKTAQYNQRTQSIKQKIQQIDGLIDTLSNEYSEKIKKCTSSSSCVQIKNSYISALQETLNEFDDIVVDLEIICLEMTNQSSVLLLRDKIMKETTTNNTELESLAHEVWLKAEDAISEYISLGTHIASESSRLSFLKNQCEQVKILKKEIHIIADEIYSQLSNATDEDTLQHIKVSMESRYTQIDVQLQEIRKGLVT